MRRTQLCRFLAGAVITAAACAPTASAHDGIDHELDVEQERVGAVVVTTHGDRGHKRTVLKDERLERSATAVSPQSEPGKQYIDYVPQIQPNCAGDGTKRYRVLYGHFADQPNRLNSFVEEIGFSLRANNGLLAQNSRQARNGVYKEARLRLNCDQGGNITIEPLVVNHGAPTFFGNIVDAVEAQYGDNDGEYEYKGDERFLVYMDASSGSTECGRGQMITKDSTGDTTPATVGSWTNFSNTFGGHVAAVYRSPTRSGHTCWVTDTALHEVLHTMGAVQPSAPHASLHLHCTDGHDVMCYDDSDPDDPPGSPVYTTTSCSWNAIDCGSDDYLSVWWPTGSTWLNTHWNIGDPTMNGWIHIHTS